MLSTQFITEIERLNSYDYEGGKQSLRHDGKPTKTYPLPGGSGLVYGFYSNMHGDLTIYIVDTNKVVGKLILHKVRNFFLPNTYSVGVITVDEDYRGRGLAKALYGIALTVKRMNLQSGSSQTPDGRRNWVSLSKIPGCEVVGALEIGDWHFTDPKPQESPAVKKKHNDKVGKIVNDLMSIGCDYQGKFKDKHWFIFPLKVTKQELAATIKNSIDVYHNSYSPIGGLWRTSMLARWIE